MLLGCPAVVPKQVLEHIGWGPDTVTPREQRTRQFQPYAQLRGVFDEHSPERMDREIVIVLDCRIRVLDALPYGEIARGKRCQSGSEFRLVGVGPSLGNWPDQH